MKLSVPLCMVSIAQLAQSKAEIHWCFFDKWEGVDRTDPQRMRALCHGPEGTTTLAAGPCLPALVPPPALPMAPVPPSLGPPIPVTILRCSGKAGECPVRNSTACAVVVLISWLVLPYGAALLLLLPGTFVGPASSSGKAALACGQYPKSGWCRLSAVHTWLSKRGVNFVTKVAAALRLSDLKSSGACKVFKSALDILQRRLAKGRSKTSWKLNFSFFRI